MWWLTKHSKELDVVWHIYTVEMFERICWPQNIFCVLLLRKKMGLSCWNNSYKVSELHVWKWLRKHNSFMYELIYSSACGKLCWIIKLSKSRNIPFKRITDRSSSHQAQVYKSKPGTCCTSRYCCHMRRLGNIHENFRFSTMAQSTANREVPLQSF